MPAAIRPVVETSYSLFLGKDVYKTIIILGFWDHQVLVHDI
jgi:hypothetical protein